VEEGEPVMAPASELPALELTMLVTKEDKCEKGAVGKGTLPDGLPVPLRLPPVNEAEEFVAVTGLMSEDDGLMVEIAVPPDGMRVPLRPPEVYDAEKALEDPELAVRFEADTVVNGIV
jgi:hypothetical protein